MAQEMQQTESIKWITGSKCEIYNEFQKQWIKGEVVDVFKDDEGEWVKIRFGRNTTELPIDSPNIRPPSDDVFTGQSDEWNVGSQCQLYSQEAMRWIDGEIINMFSDEFGEWMRIQSGQRVRDVLRDDPVLRTPTTETMNDKSGETT